VFEDSNVLGSGKTIEAKWALARIRAHTQGRAEADPTEFH
jgi:hypothetical protein